MPIPESGYENWPRGESIGLMSTVVPSARNTVRFFRFFLFRRSAASRKCGMQLRRIDRSFFRSILFTKLLRGRFSRSDSSVCLKRYLKGKVGDLGERVTHENNKCRVAVGQSTQIIPWSPFKLSRNILLIFWHK